MERVAVALGWCVMGWYRLDIYRSGAKKPRDQISFKARDRAKAGDHADRLMARRPRFECGLLYDLELTREPDGEYLVTVEGGA